MLSNQKISKGIYYTEYPIKIISTYLEVICVERITFVSSFFLWRVADRIEATGGSTEAGVVCLFGRHHKQELESETRRCCLASNLVQRPPPRGLLSVLEHSLEL